MADFKITKIKSPDKTSSKNTARRALQNGIKSSVTKFTAALFFFAVIIAVGAVHYINSRVSPGSQYNVADSQLSTTTGNGSLASQNQQTSTTTPQPNILNLPIPFTSQAPTGNWDLVHNEDCEEASSLMANAYLTGNTNTTLPAAEVETQMNNLNAWEDSHLGYHLDTTAEETAQMIEGFYGLQAKVYGDYTLQDIKDQLNLHHVVILPVNGQIIGNPNYTAPGPIYHMLVVRGYTSSGLITNDSGTRRGLNYPYNFETLHNAGADWDHNTNTIDQNKKVMIVVSK
jgi:Peptidase_C39 like family